MQKKVQIHGVLNIDPSWANIIHLDQKFLEKLHTLAYQPQSQTAVTTQEYHPVLLL